jgi:hypothetical protein
MATGLGGLRRQEMLMLPLAGRLPIVWQTF